MLESIFRNPRADHHAEYGPLQNAAIDLAAAADARREISSWPGYAATPLHSMPGMAQTLAVDQIWIKDESQREPLKSFKGLGGAYALGRVLIDHIRQRSDATIAFSDLFDHKYPDLVSEVTACCATDGNHGRSVAWGASLFGCPCVIYMPDVVSQGREDAIAAYGAQTVRVDDNYDATVERCAIDARSNGWAIIADTTIPGNEDIARLVINGYTLLASEIIDALGDGRVPTHVFLQAGVGGMAAAVTAYFWNTWGSGRPMTIIVEPKNAACHFASAQNGQPTMVTGDLETIMGGLACGEVATIAWDVLNTAADFFMTVDDEYAYRAMHMMAAAANKDVSIESGESGGSGLAALLSLSENGENRGHRRILGLDTASRVLLLNTEGATDPERYASIMRG